MMINRRGILMGLGSLLAAPAIVHAQNLMPIKVLKPAAHIPFIGDILIANGYDAYGGYTDEVVGVWDGTKWIEDPDKHVWNIQSFPYVWRE